MSRAAIFCLLLVLGGCMGIGADSHDGPSRGSVDIVDEEAVADVLNGTVVEVVDGDTVEVAYSNGTRDRIRLLGIDTPEVHVENDPAEFEGVPDSEAGASCLRETGEAAGDALRERVDGERVRIVVDATADTRDPFGRLLAYVVHDGTDLNYWLVAEGHARVYPTTFARSGAYEAAEAESRSENRGIWQCRTPESADIARSAFDASTGIPASGSGSVRPIIRA